MWKEKMTGQDLDAYTKRLIQQVEAEGLLPAPVHMKREILETMLGAKISPWMMELLERAAKGEKLVLTMIPHRTV